MAKLVPAFRALPREMQQAAACAAALMLTLFLPWYSARVLTGDAKSFNTTAWGEFSFVEAAVLLVAAGVLYLVWARSQRKGFHLPGGDGTVMLDRLGDALFAGEDAAALLHSGLAQDFALGEGSGEVRLAVPFAQKGDVSLKKVGDELVVAVDGRRRTVVLPPALAALRPAGAALDDGALVVRFA